jgi:hypothetical protein
VGIFGFLIIAGIYLRGLIVTGRVTMRLAQRPTSGDALPAVAIASTVAIFVLMQMAVLDNWLEVTRLTFIAWALVAVTHREYEERATTSQ